MTTVDETKKNGHAAPAGHQLVKPPLHLPAGTVEEAAPPTVAPGEPFDGLAAGDETTPETAGPVEQHLITVKPEPRARLAVLTGNDPILPAWVTDLAVTKQKAVRARRITGRALLLALVNSWQLFRVTWWILRGRGRVDEAPPAVVLGHGRTPAGRGDPGT